MGNKTLKWGYYTVKVNWKDDETPDLSYLVGKATNSRNEYVFDRMEGRLLGKYKEATITVKWDDVPGADMNEKGWILSSTWDKAEEMILAQIKELRIDYHSSDIGDNADLHFDDDANEFYAEISGYEILADNLGRMMGHGEYRYVHVGSNHLPHNPKNWSHVSPEDIAEVNAKHGSIEKADIAYAVEDWLRWERYGNWWCMMGCIVTIYKDNVEIAWDSCWGIESDAGDEHHNEMIESILDEALHRANIGLPAKTILSEAEELEEA
jgi:hypothetical protein